MKSLAKISIIVILILSHLLAQSIHYSILYNTLILLLTAIAFTQYWRKKETLEINIPEIIISIYVLYLFINNVFQSSFLGNSNLYEYLTILLLYFGFKLLLKNDKSTFQYILYGISASLFIEVLISFGQIFGLVQNSDTKFIIGGLFGNPGALAGFLSILTPFLLVIILSYKKIFKSENLYYALICGFLSAIFIIISSNSRGAWIASFVGIAFAMNHKYNLNKYIVSALKTKSLKATSAILSLLIIILISTTLYNYKKDSAFGRLFIWKTSLPMIAENPVFGGGFNSFANNYGKTQAAYFLDNTHTEKEVQVADYVTCAYNEFLEMLIDSGITGLLLFLLILCFALKPPLDSNSEYYFAARYSLIAFLILSMVSYPLGLAPNILILMLILFIIFNSGNYKTIQIRRFTRLISTIWFLLMLGLIYLNTMQTYGVYHFQKGYKKVIDNKIESGLQDYKNANTFLEYDGIFQFHYGSALNLNNDYNESIHHLKKATQLSSNPNAYIILGNSLKEEKRYKEAEQAYKMASGITPSKLYPKYLLANLYVKMNEKNKAIKIAQKIIGMKEKVKTTAGSEIKQEMKQLINKL